MKFLLDENVARSIEHWLIENGHDVRRANLLGAADRHWAAESSREERILISFDKEFGEIVFREHLPCHGVILSRMDVCHPSE